MNKEIYFNNAIEQSEKSNGRESRYGAVVVYKDGDIIGTGFGHTPIDENRVRVIK